MLSRKNKVPRGMFPRVLRSGSARRGAYLTLRAFRAASCEGGRTKVSFVVPKTVARTAVQRNRMKRRGYEAVKGLLPRLKPCFSCVFFFKKGAAEPSYRALADDIRLLLENADIFSR